MQLLTAIAFLPLTLPARLISGCKMPQSWQGKWFHLGFPEPLDVTEAGISGKGTCVSQKSKNMFLVRER